MDEKQIKEKSAALEVYQSQLDSLARQGEVVRLTLDDCARARQTLENLMNLRRGNELLVSIGANCFIHCSVKSAKKVLSGIGSGVVVEEDAEKALTRIEQRISETRETGQQIAKAMSEIEARAQQILSELQQAYPTEQRSTS
ncbi:MAG: prefoldin subunit alpha [Candidatus Thermoplasmatota archaeon]